MMLFRSTLAFAVLLLSNAIAENGVPGVNLSQFDCFSLFFFFLTVFLVLSVSTTNRLATLLELAREHLVINAMVQTETQ